MKSFAPEFLKSGLSIVAVDAATNKVAGILLAWDGASTEHFGVCMWCQILCCIAPHMNADMIMCNDFVEGITNSKLDDLLKEFGK